MSVRYIHLRRGLSVLLTGLCVVKVTSPRKITFTTEAKFDGKNFPYVSHTGELINLPGSLAMPPVEEVTLLYMALLQEL